MILILEAQKIGFDYINFSFRDSDFPKTEAKDIKKMSVIEIDKDCYAKDIKLNHANVWDLIRWKEVNYKKFEIEGFQLYALGIITNEERTPVIKYHNIEKNGFWTLSLGWKEIKKGSKILINN